MLARDAKGAGLTFDSKPESWKAGCMKLTLDLPEDLLKQIKIRAVNEGKTFKALMAELFRDGLAIIKEGEAAAAAVKRKKTAAQK